MPLDPAALAALPALTRVLGPDTPMVIIGATVPLVLLDFRQGGGGGRVTRGTQPAPASMVRGRCGRCQGRGA